MTTVPNRYAECRSLPRFIHEDKQKSGSRLLLKCLFDQDGEGVE